MRPGATDDDDSSFRSPVLLHTRLGVLASREPVAIVPRRTVDRARGASPHVAAGVKLQHYDGASSPTTQASVGRAARSSDRPRARTPPPTPSFIRTVDPTGGASEAVMERPGSGAAQPPARRGSSTRSARLEGHPVHRPCRSVRQDYPRCSLPEEGRRSGRVEKGRLVPQVPPNASCADPPPSSRHGEGPVPCRFCVGDRARRYADGDRSVRPARSAAGERNRSRSAPIHPTERPSAS
jgi:hypothetical protein